MSQKTNRISLSKIATELEFDPLRKLLEIYEEEIKNPTPLPPIEHQLAAFKLVSECHRGSYERQERRKLENGSEEKGSSKEEGSS